MFISVLSFASGSSVTGREKNTVAARVAVAHLSPRRRAQVAHAAVHELSAAKAEQRLAVGNADPRAHAPFTKVDSHPLYFGKAVAVVRRDKGASGPIVLKAAVKGLKPAEVEFR